MDGLLKGTREVALGFALAFAACSTSDPLVVSLPSVVAFFGQDELTSEKPDYQVGEFRRALAHARPYLEAAGVSVHEIYPEGQILVETNGGVMDLTPKLPVGYYFLGPDRAISLVYGVLDEDELGSHVETHLGVSLAN